MLNLQNYNNPDFAEVNYKNKIGLNSANFDLSLFQSANIKAVKYLLKSADVFKHQYEQEVNNMFPGYIIRDYLNK
jgi:hypothetical protein